MKLGLVALIAGIIASLVLSCAPPEAPLPPSAPTASRSVAAIAERNLTCDGQATFLGKVAVLKLPFTPQKYSNYKPPKADPNKMIAPNGSIWADLGNAFCLAPPSFQNDLLNLTAIYVNPCIEADSKKCGQPSPTACDPNNCSPGDNKIVITNSWGFRERPEQAAAVGRYIATSAGLWRGGQHAPLFRDYETRLLQTLLLGWNGPTYPPPDPLRPDPINTPEMTVLAALAHELGHVRWYDIFRPDRGSYSLDYLCGGQFFQSWKGGWQRVHFPNVWQNFGEKSFDMHAEGVQNEDILKAIANGDYAQAGTWLAQIFAADAPWASYFASISPGEDFVETYVFNVLTNAAPPLSSLPLLIPGVSASNDIPADYKAGLKQDLAFKVGCVASAPAPLFIH
jgi:hypothetical protein